MVGVNSKVTEIAEASFQTQLHVVVREQWGTGSGEQRQ